MRKIKTLLILTAFVLTLFVPDSVNSQATGSDRRDSLAVDRPFVPNQVIVKFKNTASENEKANVRARAQAQEVLERVQTDAMRDAGYGEIEVLHGPADVSRAIERLRNSPEVEFAEPNYIYQHTATSNDPYYTNGSLWGMYGGNTSPANQFGSNAAAAWAVDQTGSPTVFVGVIDEGIQYTHPDLDANIGKNPGETGKDLSGRNKENNGVDDDGNGYADDVYGWDFANNDKTIYDGGKAGTLDDHGTHVAGTIGAERNGTGVVGVNWNVKMISGKFLGRNGGTTANAIRAVDYFTNLKQKHGLNIVATNNSWGGGGFSQGLLDAITRAAKANILFVAAAGNGGSDGIGDNNDAGSYFPSAYDTTSGAGYDAVISVASITKDGAKSSFSNYGLTTVDIGAPGSGIYSTLAFNSYGSYSGTSMATPHVTGGVALYVAHYLAKYQGVLPPAAQVKDAILLSGVPTASLQGITATGRRLDVFAALSYPETQVGSDETVVQTVE